MGLDPDFDVDFSWDIPLLDGYQWVHPVNLSPRARIGGFFGLINPELWRIIRNGKFDVVVCYGYRAMSFWIAAIAAKYSGSALVLSTDAHSWVVREGMRWKLALKRLVVPRILSFGDAVLAPSTRTAAHLRKMGLDEGRVFLTPYVVNNQFFAQPVNGTRIQLRKAWGVPDDAAVALYVAKLVPWKRPQDLLNAAARVPGLHIVLAGSGVLRPELEERAAQKDLSGRVKFLGFVNQRQLPAIYAASDFLVLPSAYEPFGVVVNEAFACGRTAIVSGACGSVGDLVKDGETGYVVPVGDVEMLALRMNSLAWNGELRASLSDNAYARIKSWSPEANVDGFVRAMSEIVKGSLP
jgi:glycosyltransferase involved in cell wall biosynthesis